MDRGILTPENIIPYLVDCVKTFITFSIAVIFLTAGCSGEKSKSPDVLTTPTQKLEITPSNVPNLEFNQKIKLGYTYQKPDGNRLVSGTGTMPLSKVIDIPLAGIPMWVVSQTTEDGSVWVVVLEEGEVQAFRANKAGYDEIQINRSSLPIGTPPIVIIDGENILLNPEIDHNGSNLSHSTVIDNGSLIAFIDKDSNLVLWNKKELKNLSSRALVDARILWDENQKTLLLGNPTNRYNHGVLGDSIEAGTIIIVDNAHNPPLIENINIPPPDVIEGISPIWVDLDGDQVREIIVTLSNANSGARLAVFNEAGNLIAEGPPIGQGFRWRHQLVSAQFFPGGPPEIAVVRTPHIGGVVEFYRLTNKGLEIVAELRGFSTHRIGSRNLDAAIAGDLDGDGQIELVVPNQSQTELSGLRRTLAGVEVAWTILLPDTLTTNLSAVTTQEGKIILGAGFTNNILRIWFP